MNNQHIIKSEKQRFKQMNIAIISNIVLEPYINNYLIDLFRKQEVYPNIALISLEEYWKDEYVNQISKCDIIIIWLNIESLYRDMLSEVISGEKNRQQIINDISDVINSVHLNIMEVTNGQTIWFSFEDYYEKSHFCLGNIYNDYSIIDEINIIMRNTVSLMIDFKKLIAKIGLSNTYNNKYKYRWNCPYSEVLIKETAAEIFKQYLIMTGKSKKCIVLDCDNVLWGGILSEDGIENIKLGDMGIGRVYKDFQRFLLSLHHLGVILTVCSKNDLDNVLYIFHHHSEMILKEEHITCYQVNWNNKVSNINKISETLNIGLDSMVFIDDSYFEIEAVKSILPEVKTVLYNPDTVYESLACFNLLDKVDRTNIEKRNKTFIQNQKRDEIKSRYKAFDEYLAALNIQVTITDANDSEYLRISELSQRTNKCTNGKRYMIVELKNMAKSNYILKSVYVKDKFGDLGLVGAIGVLQKDSENILDLFCLSCRALGRNIEKQMFMLINNDYKITNYINIPSGKNTELLNLLSNLISSNFKSL